MFYVVVWINPFASFLLALVARDSDNKKYLWW